MCVCIQFYVVLFAAGLQLLSETSSTVELQSSGAGEALVQYRRLVESVGKFIDVHRRLTTIDARLRTTQQRTDHQQQQPVSGRILKSSIFLKKFYGPHKNKVTVLFYPPFDSLFFSLPFYIFSFLFFGFHPKVNLKHVKHFNLSGEYISSKFSRDYSHVPVTGTQRRAV